MKRKCNHKGFTLVELIIVIAILSVLVSVLSPVFIRYIEKAKDAVAIALVNTVKEQIHYAFLTEDTDDITSLLIPGLSSNSTPQSQNMYDIIYEMLPSEETMWVYIIHSSESEEFQKGMESVMIEYTPDNGNGTRYVYDQQYYQNKVTKLPPR